MKRKKIKISAANPDSSTKYMYYTHFASHYTRRRKKKKITTTIKKHKSLRSPYNDALGQKMQSNYVLLLPMMIYVGISIFVPYYIYYNVAQIQGCHIHLLDILFEDSRWIEPPSNRIESNQSARRINLFIHDEWVSILPNIWNNLFTLLLYMLHDQTMLWKKSRFYIEWSTTTTTMNSWKFQKKPHSFILTITNTKILCWTSNPRRFHPRDGLKKRGKKPKISSSVFSSQYTKAEFT